MLLMNYLIHLKVVVLICVEAIKNDYSALQYVHNQTPEICMYAVQRNENSLKYVIEKTLELCLIFLNKKHPELMTMT